MRPLLVALLLLSAAAPAGAVEHVLVRWKKTGQCEIVTALPLWGDHWVQLGAYPSRAQAERALAVSRKTRACPAAKSARRLEPQPERTTGAGAQHPLPHRPMER